MLVIVTIWKVIREYELFGGMRSYPKPRKREYQMDENNKNSWALFFSYLVVRGIQIPLALILIASIWGLDVGGFVWIL